MAVNETKVTKIFVGPTAPTVNKNLIWCDTSKNYQLKKFIGTSNGVDQWKVLAASEASAITIEENGQKYILQDYVLALATELDNKANASDLSNYLPLTGGVIENTDYSDSSILTVSQNSWENGKPILLVEDTYQNIGYTMDSGITVKSQQFNPTDEEIYTFSTSILPNRIEGDAVTSSVTSGSNKLLTSGGAYTALQNKQDKFTYVEEDTSIGNLYLGVVSSSNAYITLAQDGGTMEISGVSLDINSSVNPIKINSDYGVTGSAVVSTLGTSTTSAKLPTEGAVVKAISDVKTSLGSALTYEGSVENYSNLPTGLTNSDKGKVYNVVNANGNIPAGTNYAWNGTSWDALGGDMSAYLRKEGDSILSLGLFADPQNSGELRISSFNPDSGHNPSDTSLTGDTLTFSVADGPTTIYSAYGFEINPWGRDNPHFKVLYSGITGSLVDTSITSTPEDGHIATTDAIKTYVDNSTLNKVEKNSNAELNALIMPTFNSSGVQNGKAKIMLYKDDTTGAITIEAEGIIE